ncbi:MAG: hypothetical protein AAF662_05590 [Pseudomonadota bacterium]
MALIDCRDCSITLWQEGHATSSPGFVLADGKQFTFGQAALEHSRLRPRDSSSRFWWQLSTQPLKPPLGAARHSADLVHAHLQTLHRESAEPEAASMVIPESMPTEQLSLLLGIAQACDFSVKGLVSRSALLASLHMPEDTRDQTFVHVEAQLNQTVVSQLRSESGRVHVEKSTPLPSCGLLGIYERCISAIATAFVQQTRFDPRRSAESEQLLFNQLPQLLTQLKIDGETSVTIDSHRCRFTSATLDGVLEKLRSGIADATEGKAVSALLDAEFSALPGIEEMFNAPRFLDAAELWTAWERQRGEVELGDPELHLVDHLPSLGKSGNDPVGSQDGSVSSSPPDGATGLVQVNQNAAPENGLGMTLDAATHVLIGIKAMPLRGDQINLVDDFSLRLVKNRWTLHGPDGLVNGLPSHPQQALELGDTLTLGTAGHGRLIQVCD